MSNVLFGFPVFSDDSPLYTPTISGGSWLAALPLSNLRNRYLHRVARSSSDAVADTIASIDLGVNRDVRVLALVNHNLSSAAYLRWRGWTALPFQEIADFASGWSSSGTPTRSAAAVTATDGVSLDLIGDNDAAAVEGYTRNVSFTGDGVKVFAFRIRQGTSTSSIVRMNDVTAATERGRAQVTWSGGVPVVTMGAVNPGTHLSTTDLGGGDYRIAIACSTVTAANTNQFGVFPAYDLLSDVSLQGDAYIGEFEFYDSATDPLVANAGASLGLPSGTTAETRDGWLPTHATVYSSAKTARYWRLNIADTTNAATYVQIGRLIIAGGYQPTVNASYGATLGYTDPHSTHDDADGGATIHGAKPRRRTCDLLCELQSESEAFGTPFEMAQRLGTTGQLFFVFDPADTTLLWKRSFLATLRELSPIEFTHPTYHSTPFRVTEEL